MKTVTIKNMKSVLFYFLTGIILISSCKKETDTRQIEAAKIVAVKINEILYIPETKVPNEALIKLPDGTDLSAVKTEVLVANGTIVDFKNKDNNDMRSPVNLNIQGSNGASVTWKLTVQSAPKLVSLTVDGLDIPKEKVFFGKTSIITQVNKGTDISKLAVRLEFLNGTMQNFTNGTVKDYTNPFKLQVVGTDSKTIYTYDVVFTSEPVGPAYLKSITINGMPTDSLQITNNVVQPYVPYLTNFTAASLSFSTGFGNIVDPSFVGTNVNMYTDFKVKITGSNGVETTFTIKRPLIASNPILERTHEQLQYAANAGSSAAFSGNNVLICSHAMNAGSVASLGINVYDLSGNYLKGLSKNGTNFDGGAVTGVRKFATDSNGKILGIQLGAGAGATTDLKIFMWNNVDDNAPTSYITYNQNTLGLSYAPRAAGINVTGSLSGNAVITVPMAQKQDVLVWTVTNGTLNPTPQKLSFPYSGTGFYYSIESFATGYIGAATGTNFNGVNLMNSTMGETLKITGVATTDIKTITYNGRKYAAFTILASTKHIFRILDITTQDQTSLDNPIFNIVGTRIISNANNTLDSDFAVINGKLHVLFYGTNDRLAVYQLEN
jgi:hypothetical protein